MVKIKEFEPKYNEEVNDFIISIFVDEYKFQKYKESLKIVNNMDYSKSGGQMWIAVNKEDKVVGTIAIMKKDSETVELKSFYVNKDYRGIGISKQLYSEIIKYCEMAQIKRIFLGTYNNMETAIYFYKKRGFSEIKMDHEDSGAIFFEKYI